MKALGEFGEDVAGDELRSPGEGEVLDGFLGLDDGEGGEGRKGEGAFEVDVASGFVEASAVAVGADDEFVFVGFVELAVVVDFGFGDGVEGGGVNGVTFVGDVAVTTTGFAPAAWRVEGEVTRIGFFKGATSGSGDTCGRKGDDFFVSSEKAAGAFAYSQGFGEFVSKEFC